MCVSIKSPRREESIGPLLRGALGTIGCSFRFEPKRQGTARTPRRKRSRATSGLPKVLECVQSSAALASYLLVVIYQSWSESESSHTFTCSIGNTVERRRWGWCKGFSLPECW